MVKNLPSAFSTPNLSNRRKLEGEEHGSSSRGGRGGGGDPFPTPGGSGGPMNLEKSSSYINGSGGGGQSRHRSCSPVNCSPNARDKGQDDRGDDYPGDGERDINGTPNSDITDRSTPDDPHISKRK